MKIHEPKPVALATLKRHPRNYRTHSAEQLLHIKRSIEEHGFYRNIVIANDEETILAGHGVVEALIEMGEKQGPCVVVDCKTNSPQALKILAGDNTIANLAEDDERALTEMLKEIAEGEDLLGTGFDESMLAGLLMVTRPESEIPDMDSATQYAGMEGAPDHEEAPEVFKLVLQCESDEGLNEVIEQLGLTVSQRHGKTVSCRWPPQKQGDPGSLFVDG